MPQANVSDDLIKYMKDAVDKGMALKENRIVGDAPIALMPKFISITHEESDSAWLNAVNGGLYRKESLSPSAQLSIDVRVGDDVNGTGYCFNSVVAPIGHHISELERIMEKNIKKGFYESTGDYFSHHSTISTLRKNPFKKMLKLDPIVKLDSAELPDIDMDELAQIAEEQSKELGKREGIEEGSVSYNIKTVAKRFVSSEGTMLMEKNWKLACIITFTIKDSDGRMLEFFDVISTSDLKKIPKAEKIRRIGDVLYKPTIARIDCPVQEAGYFPVLCDGLGIGVLFHETIAAHLLSAKYILEQNLTTFDFSKLGQKVMPEFISLYDNPRLKEALKWNYSEFDDEGVPTQRRVLVENGILKGHLHDRHTAAVVSEMLKQPIYSGNSRREPNSCEAPEPRISNLEIITSQPKSFKEMKMELITRCIKEGAPYGIWFFGGGGVVSVEESNEEGGTPGASEHLPRFLYRIYPDGKIIPVKCAHLTGTAYQLLNSVVMLGANRKYHTGYCGSDSGFIGTGEFSMSGLLSKAEFSKEKKDVER